MTDKRLRAQQRRANQGDPEAEAKALRERMLAGQVHERWVALAAQLWSKAAAALIPEVLPAPNGHKMMTAFAIHTPMAAQLKVLVAIIDHVRREWRVRTVINGDLQGAEAICDGVSLNEIEDHVIARFLRQQTPATTQALAEQVTSMDTYLRGLRIHDIEKHIVVCGTDLMGQCLMMVTAVVRSRTAADQSLRLFVPWFNVSRAYARFLASTKAVTKRASQRRSYELIAEAAVAALLADRS